MITFSYRCIILCILANGSVDDGLAINASYVEKPNLPKDKLVVVFGIVRQGAPWLVNDVESFNVSYYDKDKKFIRAIGNAVYLGQVTANDVRVFSIPCE